MKHLRYLSYVLRHKWYVLVECWKAGLYWRGITHDLSKFRPSEWFPYTNHFYGPQPQERDETGYYKPTDTGDIQFDFAWLLHQKRNRHHWQWWILPEDEGGFKVMRMPDRDVIEMVCDWRGAGRAQGYVDEAGRPEVVAWYEKNKDRMRLHVMSRRLVERLIAKPAMTGWWWIG